MTDETKKLIKLEDVLPSVRSGFGSVGFFFGAGTSVEAGFPTLSKLTSDVFKQLDVGDKAAIQTVLRANKLSLPNKVGEPNIEEIADCLQDHLLSMRDGLRRQKIEHAEESLRTGIVNVLDGIQKTDLSNHVRFFEAIKTLLDGRPSTIWIITTNYDRCLEIAASLAGVNLIDGFLGTTLRYFSPNSFQYDLTTPNREDKRMATRWKAPTIKLIKLHGSLDWYSDIQSSFASPSPIHLPKEALRSLILPRKRKESDTLEYPYNDLFEKAVEILGVDCKYLISCGYRFADDHINRRLLLPKLRSANLKLCAFLSKDSSNLAGFHKYQSFNLITPKGSIIDGKNDPRGSESCIFSKLVEEIGGYTGN